MGKEESGENGEGNAKEIETQPGNSSNQRLKEVALHKPLRYKPLSHQVAGHHKNKGKDVAAFLECDDGSILKPIQPPPKGQRELKFFQMVFDNSCTNKCLLRLKKFLPEFQGTWQSPEGVSYFKMADVAKFYRKPCILDIKVGPITYDPDASPEKIASEKAKYPPLEKVGFQILGFRLYRSSTGEYTFYDRSYGKSLAADEVMFKGLGRYFGMEDGLRCDVIQAALRHLVAIQEWFKSQRELCFYASSLLFVYEGLQAKGEQEIRESPKRKRQKLESQSEIEENDCLTEAKFSNCDIKSRVDSYGRLGVRSSDSHDTLYDKQSGDCTKLSKTSAGLTKSSTHAVNSVKCCTVGKTADNECNRLDSNTVDECCVKMIDFTHVFPTEKTDENYLFGLNNLIDYLRKLLNYEGVQYKDT